MLSYGNPPKLLAQNTRFASYKFALNCGRFSEFQDNIYLSFFQPGTRENAIQRLQFKHKYGYFVLVGRTSILLGKTFGFIFNKSTIICPKSDG